MRPRNVQRQYAGMVRYACDELVIYNRDILLQGYSNRMYVSHKLNISKALESYV